MSDSPPHIHVLEARTPKRGFMRWMPIPAYSSNNGSECVLRASEWMRSMSPDSQFRVVLYARERSQ